MVLSVVVELRVVVLEMMGSVEFTKLQREVLAEIRAESIAIAALGDALA